MAQTDLCVIVCGQPCGTLSQDSHGLISFTYHQNYDGIPLSLAMPVTNRTYGQATVLPYLFGLLPDSEQQRRAIASEYGISPNNPMSLLRHIGLDCPGAVQFCLPENLKEVLDREGRYQPLSESQIAQRLKSLRSAFEETWMGRSESWSLGGNQGKFALGLHDGLWCECQGSAPTTHIFKNGVKGFKLEALNEYVCMRTARECGLETADVDYRLFEDEPALIVTRYDRAITQDGTVARLHQEDLCQSLCVMPDKKYTADGGPTASDVLELLAATEQAQTNLTMFTQGIFYNCLIGAPDAHAKNYSLLLGRRSNALLSPLYDVASGLAYENARRKGRLAMAIGGENRFGRIGRGAIERYAGKNDPSLKHLLTGVGLTADTCAEIMAELALKVPQAMVEVFNESLKASLPGADELQDHMLGAVEENCQKTLALLG